MNLIFTSKEKELERCPLELFKMQIKIRTSLLDRNSYNKNCLQSVESNITADKAGTGVESSQARK